MHADDGWTFDPTCECERCVDHHATTCLPFAVACTQDPDGLDGIDCACPEPSGVTPDHAAWAHPNTPIRERLW